MVSYSGARLCLPELNVYLTIPEGAIARGHRQEVTLSVLQEDKHRPRLSGEKSFVRTRIIHRGIILVYSTVLTLADSC